MNVKSKLLISALSGVAAVAFVGQAEARTLRLAHYMPTEEVLHSASQYFSERVKELSNGDLSIEIFPANQLGAPQEVAEQVRLGLVDMSHNTGGQLQLWVPEYAAIQLPFLWESADHAYTVLDGEGGEILGELAAEEGFVQLSHWEHGFRAISNSVRPIENVDDLEGLSIRVPPEVPMEAAMRAAGAVPTQISFPELYLALAQGSVDGQENPVRHIFYNRFFEHQEHVAIPGPGYMYLSSVHVVSQRVWDDLSTNEQEVIRQASLEARDWMREQIAQEDSEAIAELEAAGVTITRPVPSDFQEAMQPAWQEIAEFAGESFVEQWLTLVDQAR